MFCRPPRPASIVTVRPDQLINMVIARPWAIIDLEKQRGGKAPYAVALDCPLLVMAAVQDYADKNIALLCDSELHAEAVGTIMIAQGFEHNVALTGKTEWIKYWDDVDAGRL